METRMNRGVVLYGIGDEHDGYAVLRYWRMFHEEVSIRSIERNAELMRAECPGVDKVFVIDNEYGLRRDYLEAKRMNSFAGWIMFRDILERQGIEWPKR